MISLRIDAAKFTSRASIVTTLREIVQLANADSCANLDPMKNISHHLATLLLTAWVGSLWAIGYLAVPVLFSAQADKQLAGMLAGRMFMTAGYFGMFCAAYLLLQHLAISGRVVWRQTTFVVILMMLFITLLIQFGFQPIMAELKTLALPLDVMQSELASSFKALHGASSIAYLVESLLGGFLIIKMTRQKP